MMRLKRITFIAAVLLLNPAFASAQDVWDTFRNRAQEERCEFVRQARKRYADYLKDSWTLRRDSCMLQDPLRREDCKPVELPPAAPPPRRSATMLDAYTFPFYGDRPTVRLSSIPEIALDSVDEAGVAAAWEDLENRGCEELLQDCLSLRSQRSLCDWAYAQMLDSLTCTVYPGRPSDQQLLFAFLMGRSGLDFRLGISGGSLVALVGIEEPVYSQIFFNFGDVRFYPLRPLPHDIRICEANYPDTRPMTLRMQEVQVFPGGRVYTRHIEAANGVTCDFRIGENQLRFLSSYPHTLCSIKAGAPTGPELEECLYPVLKDRLNGLCKEDAVNVILGYVGSASTYRTDHDNWGFEKWNFPEESCLYPSGDCEDYAILFCRLVRDLVGLDCVLVHADINGSSPHLGAAVLFNQPVKGCVVHYDGHDYCYCEPVSRTAKAGEQRFTDFVITSIEPVN